MLLRTLFVAILLTALAESIVHGVHALAQSALHRQALAAVHDEVLSGTTLARGAIARAIDEGADPRRVVPAMPSPSTQCRMHVEGACAIEGTARITFDSPAQGGGSSPSPCPNDACAIYEQENDAVTEGRAAATIAAEALGPEGAVLAARTSRVTFRTMRVPPFAVPVGHADGSAADAGNALQAGDDGGFAGGTAGPGTLIDVIYRNAATGAAIPANVWRSQLQSGIPTSQPWSP